jgi:hypothetical protein
MDPAAYADNLNSDGSGAGRACLPVGAVDRTCTQGAASGARRRVQRNGTVTGKLQLPKPNRDSTRRNLSLNRTGSLRRLEGRPATGRQPRARPAAAAATGSEPSWKPLGYWDCAAARWRSISGGLPPRVTG